MSFSITCTGGCNVQTKYVEFNNLQAVSPVVRSELNDIQAVSPIVSITDIRK
jgi:hypothetical protein